MQKLRKTRKDRVVKYDITQAANWYDLNGLNSKLRLLRVQSGMTLRDIAIFLDCTGQTVQNYEQGRSLPALDYLVSFCELFHVRLDDLIAVDRPTRTWIEGEYEDERTIGATV